jgi:hypothetical protein
MPLRKKCEICKRNFAIIQRGDGMMVCHYVLCTNGIIIDNMQHHNQRMCSCNRAMCNIVKRTDIGGILTLTRMPECVMCYNKNPRCVTKNCINKKFCEIIKAHGHSECGKLYMHCYKHIKSSNINRVPFTGDCETSSRHKRYRDDNEEYKDIISKLRYKSYKYEKQLELKKSIIALQHNDFLGKKKGFECTIYNLQRKLYNSKKSEDLIQRKLILQFRKSMDNVSVQQETIRRLRCKLQDLEKIQSAFMDDIYMQKSIIRALERKLSESENKRSTLPCKILDDKLKHNDDISKTQSILQHKRPLDDTQDIVRRLRRKLHDSEEKTQNLEEDKEELFIANQRLREKYVKIFIKKIIHGKE